MATTSPQSPENEPILPSNKASGPLRIVVAGGLSIFAVMVTLVSALVVNTFLSYALPRICSESPRKDVYEIPSLDTWAIVMKHGVTLALSVWAGISTWQYLIGPRLREGHQVDQMEKMMIAHEDGLPCPMCQQDLPSQRRQEQGVESATRRAGAENHRARPSTPSMHATIQTVQDWTKYEAPFDRTSVSGPNDINDEGGALSVDLASDATEWDPQLRQWLKYLPRQPPLLGRLTRLTLDEATQHKVSIIQNLISCSRQPCDESTLERCIVLDVSTDNIPTFKAIEDEYQHLRYHILAQKPSMNQIWKVYAFRQLVNFNMVKCWVSMNLHMRRDGGFPSVAERGRAEIGKSLTHSQPRGGS